MAPCVRRMPARQLPGLRSLLRLGLCSLFGALLCLLLMVGLLFCGQRALLQLLVGSGQWLGELILQLLPASFWQALTGIEGAASHPDLRSLAGLCASLGQGGLLLGCCLYRYWYRREE